MKKNEEGVCSPQRRANDGNEQRFRLIERYFPSHVVSERSRSERYQRGKTPHTIFTWWARRPFAAARAVMVTSLIEATSVEDKSCELIEQYCRGEDPGVLRMALEPLMNAKEQRVLDLFGGGGTIPLEAGRLGARVWAVENNQLAHFIQKTLLERSVDAPRLARQVRRAGQRLLEDLEQQTRDFFPAREAGDAGRTVAYLFTRELQCPGCQGWLSLTKRPWLSKRSNRRLYVRRRPCHQRGEYTVELASDGSPQPGCLSAWRGRQIECPFCDHQLERDELGELMRRSGRDRLMAACTSRGRHKNTRKQFHLPDEQNHLPEKTRLLAAMIRDLKAMGRQLPEASLPRWSGVTNPALYGMADHVELFNLRQRAVLVRMCRLLEEHHDGWKQNMDDRRADTVAAFLSAFIDQLVDWNSRLSTWISQNEQVGRGLSGPGMAMVWDHVEIDPVEEAPANLWDKLERIVSGIRSIPQFHHRPKAVRADARDLPFDDDSFDVIATDPPYFDNVFYSVLADCIYVWKRLALKEVFPDLFGSAVTDRDRELTMNRHRFDDEHQARAYYTEGMKQVFVEAERVLAERGVLAVVFAHSTVEGWASVAEAQLEAGLQLVAAWPMYVERTERPRAMGSRAVNTSFVLVVRKKRKDDPKRMDLQQFDASLQQRLERKHEAMELAENYGANARSRTLFGLGVAYYTQVGQVVDDKKLTTTEVIERIADTVEQMVGQGAWRIERN